MAEIHYRTETGVSAYQEGDLLINDDTGERSRVVRDGRGLCLEPAPPAPRSDAGAA